MSEPYETLYADFIKDYVAGSVTGEQVGELVAKLAGYYPNYNLTMARNERAYALICKDEVLKTDESTGKAISSAKAETIAASSPEATAFKISRAYVQNLEMLIQSAKALQRGLLQESVHSNLQ